MMIKELAGREFNFDPRLRATEKIKGVFKKDYTKVLENMETMEIKDLIKFIHCVIKDPITFEEFYEYVMDNCGKGDIDEMVSWLVMQLQFPGITEEEFIKKIQERQKANAQLTTMQD